MVDINNIIRIFNNVCTLIHEGICIIFILYIQKNVLLFLTIQQRFCQSVFIDYTCTIIHKFLPLFFLYIKKNSAYTFILKNCQIYFVNLHF